MAHRWNAFGHRVLRARRYKPASIGQFVLLTNNLIRVLLVVQKGTPRNSLMMIVIQSLTIRLEYDYFAAMPMFKRTRMELLSQIC